MSYNDLRKGRFSAAQQAYFVTTVLADRQQAIFNDFACARLLIQHMRALHESKHISSIAWVVMPDHIHCRQPIARKASHSNIRLAPLGCNMATVVNKYTHT